MKYPKSIVKQFYEYLKAMDNGANESSCERMLDKIQDDVQTFEYEGGFYEDPTFESTWYEDLLKEVERKYNYSNPEW